MRVRSMLLAILLMAFALVPTLEASRKGYMLRKGSRLEQQHRRSLHEWRKAYLHRHHKPRYSNKFEDLLSKMDTLIRPRFG